MSLDQVVTLIAGPGHMMPPDLPEAARAALFRLGAELGPALQLGNDEAIDLPFAGLDADQADAAIRGIVGDRPIDLIAQPSAGRRKRMLFADMESTLIRNEMLDELAQMVGIGAAVAAITARAMNGEIGFEAALAARVELLTGLSSAVLDDAASRIELMPGAATLVATMRCHGASAIMVSGGFHYFADRVGADLAIDRVFANTLEIADGRLTGRVHEPILGPTTKFELLTRTAADFGLSLDQIACVGDGANDLLMIEAAGLGVAFRAKPFLRARARWRLDHADLTGLLYAQGYRREEFVTPPR
jgi:phosphoserine phosphatase